MDRAEKRAGGTTEERAAQIKGAQAVGRAVEVLCAVAKCQRNGATLSKIVSVTALSRSTAFRLLHYLADARLLRFDEQQRRYYVGPLAYELGLAARGQSELTAHWMNRMENVALETGLTTYLVARSGLDGVCLATTDPLSAIPSVPCLTGLRMPLGIGAASLAILSSLSDMEIDAIIAAHGFRLRTYSCGRITPEVLRRHVKMTRIRGYAFSQNIVTKGMLAIAVRIPGDSEQPDLALGVSSAATKMSDAEQFRIAETIQDILLN